MRERQKRREGPAIAPRILTRAVPGSARIIPHVGAVLSTVTRLRPARLLPDPSERLTRDSGCRTRGIIGRLGATVNTNASTFPDFSIYHLYPHVPVVDRVGLDRRSQRDPGPHRAPTARSRASNSRAQRNAPGSATGTEPGAKDSRRQSRLRSLEVELHALDSAVPKFRHRSSDRDTRPDTTRCAGSSIQARRLNRAVVDGRRDRSVARVGARPTGSHDRTAAKRRLHAQDAATERNVCRPVEAPEENAVHLALDPACDDRVIVRLRNRLTSGTRRERRHATR